MTSRGDKALTPKFSLPLVGLGTCYYEFSKENPDAGVRRHRGGLRRRRSGGWRRGSSRTSSASTTTLPAVR